MLAFYPNLTPRQVIEEGAYGGSYYGCTIEDPVEYDYETLFKYHFEGLEEELYLGEKYKPKSNKWKVRSGKDYRYWKDMGWIHKQDPYGWFEWWCKYDMGRRSQDDKRQIARWQDFCGTKGRWRNNIYSQIAATGWSAKYSDREERNAATTAAITAATTAGYSDREERNISPRIQQSLRHWGYEINEADYQEWLFYKNKSLLCDNRSDYRSDNRSDNR